MTTSTTIIINNLDEVKSIVSSASSCPYKVTCSDVNNHVADASSILGMLSLDYKHPVTLACNNENALTGILDSLAARTARA